jgi:hypothetical protein
MRHRRPALRDRLRAVLGSAGLAALVVGSAATVSADASPCLTPLLEDEPLCSPALADSPWPISHHGAYAQGSSSLPGPVEGGTVEAQHLIVTGPPITLAMSPAYPDGGRAIWGSVIGLTGEVFKLDHDTFSLIDSHIPAEDEVNPPAIPLGVSGAYSVADADFNFILGRARYVEIYRDAVPGDRPSGIELAKRITLPSSALCRPNDLLVGGVMLPDGMLAFVTKQAVVGVVPSNVDDLAPENVVALPSENGAACADAGIPDADLEEVSNSLAADEHGGIYAVTDAAVVKYQWDGTSLQKVWRTPYASDPPFSILRLGPGSGSTPSLMGTAVDDDRFVVITDGQELMHLVLMWRDEVPAGWQPIAPGKDPRIACEVSVDFGDPMATRSLSEQSVLVRGYSSIVVNNLLTDESGLDTGFPILNPGIAALEGGNPARAPHGAERIDWDPATKTCSRVWVNPTVSLPNAIPTMSAASDRVYAIGQRGGVWGLEVLDYLTGESTMFVPSTATTCPTEVIEGIAGTFLGPILLPIIDRLPASCENSFFSATEVGPDGTIYTGTFQGVSRFVPSAVPPVPGRRQARAGIAQARDLAARAGAAVGTDAAAAQDALARAETQLAAGLDAIGIAGGDGSLDASSTAGAAASAGSALAHLDAASAAAADPVSAALEIAGAATDLADAADWLTACPPAPQAGCGPAARSRLVVLQRGGSHDMVDLRWMSPEPVSGSALPDPTRRTTYALCLYDATGRLAALRIAPHADRWRRLAKGGLVYRDGDGGSDGVIRALVRAGGSRARIRLTSRGASTPAVPLPATPPLTVQLVNGDTAACWGATYDVGELRRNDPSFLRAHGRQ